MQLYERTSWKSETEFRSVLLDFKESIKLLIGGKKSLTGSSDNLFLTFQCLMSKEKMALEGLGLFTATSCFLSLVCPLTSFMMMKKQTEERKADRLLIFQGP